MIADRIDQIDSSGIRKVFDLAKSLKNPINLSIGQPHFDIPENIKTVGAQSLKDGFNQYTQTQGIAELRDNIAQHLSKTRLWEPDDLIVTSGVSGAIFLAFLSLLNPGDEVIVPDPYFVMYKHLVKLIGAKPIFVDTYPDFQFTAERIAPCLSEKTKLIILNSPSNPTGALMPCETLKNIADLAKEKNILLMSDEIYDAFSYDQAYPSIAQYSDNILLLGGFSKNYCMTGWRIGFAAGPREVIQAMTKLQQYTFVCAPSVAQKMAIEALHTDTTAYINEYKRKRDIIYHGIKDHFEVVKPDGAFYIFPKAPKADADTFVNKAIQKNLLVIPGNVFSERNTHFRISFAANDDTIVKGIEILTALT